MSGMFKSRRLLIMLVIVSMVTACNDIKKGDQSLSSNEQISQAEWQSIMQKKIIFGHQSVGYNVLTGVKSLATLAGVNIKLIESRTTQFEPSITHFTVGRNKDPYSKIKDFEDTLRSGSIQGADIALMKLCYIDINRDTDVFKLAKDYIASLDRLSQEYPKTVFIAVTAPIRTVQSGPKAWLKRLLGRDPTGYADNLSRQNFNKILRDTYAKQGRLFDLANFESKGAGSHQCQGQPLEVLNPALSDDGGHLNTHGQLYVATSLLKFIASLPGHPS